MDSLRRLEEIFAHFPGIGPRQARRFAYYLLGKPPAFIKEFTSLIEEVRRSTAQCPQCYRLFINASKASICSTCSDKSRDVSSLMVVARDSDFESIEKSGAYKGLYFILGGTVPILDKEPEKRIRLRQLLERISDTKSPHQKDPGIGLKEIILSLNTTPEGEHTADIVRDALAKVSKNLTLSPEMKITILGRGLSTGAELEYADGETIQECTKE